MMDAHSQSEGQEAASSVSASASARVSTHYSACDSVSTSESASASDSTHQSQGQDPGSHLRRTGEAMTGTESLPMSITSAGSYDSLLDADLVEDDGCCFGLTSLFPSFGPSFRSVSASASNLAGRRRSEPAVATSQGSSSLTHEHHVGYASGYNSGHNSGHNNGYNNGHNSGPNSGHLQDHACNHKHAGHMRLPSSDLSTSACTAANTSTSTFTIGSMSSCEIDSSAQLGTPASSRCQQLNGQVNGQVNGLVNEHVNGHVNGQVHHHNLRRSSSRHGGLATFHTNRDTHGDVAADTDADIMHETPSFVRSKIKEMIRNIKHIPAKKRRVFDHARFLHPRLLKDHSLFLMFLRADLFHTQRAARRLCAFLHVKKDLFGFDSVLRRITRDDLDLVEREILNRGELQPLQAYDQFGRKVLFTRPTLERLDPTAMTRCLFYIMLSTLEGDVRAQRNGCVQIIYLNGLSLNIHNLRLKDQMVRLKKAASVLPYRLVTTHECYSNTILKPLVTFASSASQKRRRTKVRCHFGSTTECLYALNAFGIPIADLPVSQDGHIIRVLCERPLHASGDSRAPIAATSTATARNMEESKICEEGACDPMHVPTHSSSSWVQIPKEHDILLGRSARCLQHPGNVRLSDLIKTHSEKYNSTIICNIKTSICDDILQTIRANGNSFLCRRGTDNGWDAVPDSVAIDEIHQAFRMQNSPGRSRQRAMNEWDRRPSSPMKKTRTVETTTIIDSSHLQMNGNITDTNCDSDSAIDNDNGSGSDSNFKLNQPLNPDLKAKPTHRHGWNQVIPAQQHQGQNRRVQTQMQIHMQMHMRLKRHVRGGSAARK